MKKTCLFFFFCVLFAGMLPADGQEIRGRVFESKGVAAKNAKVIIPGVDTANSDSAGWFSLNVRRFDSFQVFVEYQLRRDTTSMTAFKHASDIVDLRYEYTISERSIHFFFSSFTICPSPTYFDISPPGTTIFTQEELNNSYR
ncbi:MAG: hypothetical protein KF744_04765 [Taibaiella sp.]|nr:hypothetical protein [Taibaiella sp.]